MLKIIKYVISDILRSRTIIAYMVLLLALAFSVLGMESNAEKGIVSLLNIVLFVVPLVSIIFATVYLYNSAEFIELLVSQPLKRTKIWGSIFFGIIRCYHISFFNWSRDTYHYFCMDSFRYPLVGMWGGSFSNFCFYCSVDGRTDS